MNSQEGFPTLKRLEIPTQKLKVDSVSQDKIEDGHYQITVFYREKSQIPDPSQLSKAYGLSETTRVFSGDSGDNDQYQNLEGVYFRLAPETRELEGLDEVDILLTAAGGSD